MVYSPTFTMKINQMWVNIPYMDPMGLEQYKSRCFFHVNVDILHFGIKCAKSHASEH